MLSHHILMNILCMNFYNYFVTKRTLNNAPYRKFLLNCKQHSKTKRIFKLNVFLTSFLPYLYAARIWLNLIKSQAFRSSRLQMFYKIRRCSWKFCKIHRKIPMLDSVFNKVANVLFYDLCEILRTHTLKSPSKSNNILRIQISKVT